ncbi:MAG: hypothetical protein HY716_01760 [Planctomycetes bacterium]|nr:hypothetical protein [Planctomycetota bacterium]
MTRLLVTGTFQLFQALLESLNFPSQLDGVVVGFLPVNSISELPGLVA